MAWFQDEFGFRETTYKQTRDKFELQENGTVMVSKENKQKFKIGPFETPSANDLHARWDKIKDKVGGSGITFKNIIGDARALHLDPKNAGGVFQAASQFNCLEMVGPGVTPERGVTGYANDRTQGPACALSCPAATVARNYFAGKDGYPSKTGQGGQNQINTCADIEKLLENDKNRYWRMSNGYMLETQRGSIGELGLRLSKDNELAEKISGILRVGVHWSTQTMSTRMAKRQKREPHQVAQVFASAVPVGYSREPKASWRPMACAVLNGLYDSTLGVAALLAAQNGKRVTCFLTMVGGGVFANSHSWIADGITRALGLWKDAPIDVQLVHFRSIGSPAYTKIKCPKPSSEATEQKQVQCLEMLAPTPPSDEKKVPEKPSTSAKVAEELSIDEPKEAPKEEEMKKPEETEEDPEQPPAKPPSKAEKMLGVNEDM